MVVERISGAALGVLKGSSASSPTIGYASGRAVVTFSSATPKNSGNNAKSGQVPQRDVNCECLFCEDLIFSYFTMRTRHA